MSEWKVPVQSLIDHIKTAIDVDPWAKEMIEDLLKEQDVVEPKFVRNEWRCGVCGHVVLTYCFDINEGEMGKVMANYCPSCGRKVKWE